jgi:hypothetical protein
MAADILRRRLVCTGPSAARRPFRWAAPDPSQHHTVQSAAGECSWCRCVWHSGRYTGCSSDSPAPRIQLPSSHHQQTGHQASTAHALGPAAFRRPLDRSLVTRAPARRHRFTERGGDRWARVGARWTGIICVASSRQQWHRESWKLPAMADTSSAATGHWWVEKQSNTQQNTRTATDRRANHSR